MTESDIDRICVVGLGYVGLPIAAVLATEGCRVFGVDIDAAKRDAINAGETPFEEPGLQDLVREAHAAGTLSAHETPRGADVFIIAVPTPFTDDRTPDLESIEAATESIASVVEHGDLVVLESTVPVGMTETVAEILGRERPELNIAGDGTAPQVHVAHCPERILPGNVLTELRDNDRIVGGVDEQSAERARSLYERFVNGDVLLTDDRTAELTKLTENAYRDINIAFANELDMLCDELGIDVWEVRELANRHPRVEILEPGPGVGGHCIPIDPWFIVASAPENTDLVRTARAVNDRKPEHVVEQVRSVAAEYDSPRVACLGMTYKPGVDDLRESPALEITVRLAADGFDLSVVDPHVSALPSALDGRDNVSLETADEALDSADIVVLLVAHREFAEIVTDELQADVVDTKGYWR